MPVRSLVLLAALGGVVELDRVAFLQTMLSRPLVSATAAGWLLGEPALGLFSGALLELFWLMELPVGASLPPDEGLAGVLAAVFALSAPGSWPAEARAGLGVLLALPFGYGGRFVERAVRRWNGRLLLSARERVSAGHAPGGLHLLGGCAFFFSGAFAVVAGSLAGSWALAYVCPLLPEATVRTFAGTAAVLPLLGVAAVFVAFRSHRQRGLFAAGLVGAALLGRGSPLGGRSPWRL
jgi:PTS system mannose-specific IIC component